MAKKEAYKVSEVIDAIKKADGYVSQAAALLGCHVTTVYNYAERHPTVKQAWNNIKEKRHDFVENQLMRGIKDGNMTGIIFYSKTQMKHRGYVERQQIEHSGKINVSELSDEELQAIIEA